MTGLQRVLKATGEMSIESNGEKVLWVWDYARDIAVIKSEMTKEQWRESEKAKWENVFIKNDNK